MNSVALAESALALTVAYHRSFLLQMVGPEVAGISAPEAAMLISLGILTEKEAQGPWVVPGLGYNVDAFMFAVMMGSIMAEEASDPGVIYKAWKDVTRLRTASLRKWINRMRVRLRYRIEFGAPAATITNSGAPWLTPEETGAWLSARTRAAKYITAIGEDVQRNIRAVIASAIESGDNYGQLAEKLAKQFGEAQRDWRRVARTELQAAYNEGVVAATVSKSGYNARIARVPEKDACTKCKKLFLEDGIPRIFSIRELMANGTNVGKKKADWLSTVWPVHPNCRCDTVSVPPGYGFDRNWNLVPADRS